MKSERETELINEQVLMAMSEMGLDRERTLQVGPTHTHTRHIVTVDKRCSAYEMPLAYVCLG